MSSVIPLTNERYTKLNLFSPKYLLIFLFIYFIYNELTGDTEFESEKERFKIELLMNLNVQYQIPPSYAELNSTESISFIMNFKIGKSLEG